MCGIYCSVPLNREASRQPKRTSICPDMLTALLTNRGPNANAVISVDDLVFGAYVLWQQGSQLCLQPLETSNLILLFNGDLFGIEQQFSDPKPSDTQWLANNLDKCRDLGDMLTFMQTIHGPYSIVVYYKSTGDLFFARDSLGRNSLILEKRVENNNVPCLRLLSTSYLNERDMATVVSVELPPVGLYKLNVSSCSILEFYAWSTDTRIDDVDSMAKTLHLTIERKERIINPDWIRVGDLEPIFFSFHDMCKDIAAIENQADIVFDHLLRNPSLNAVLNDFSKLLEQSVKDRVQATPAHCRKCISHLKYCNHSKIGLLFSGGIDCTILALLCDKYIDGKDSIDLINVAFENNSMLSWDVPDRVSAKRSLQELQKTCPGREWHFFEVNVTRKELDVQLKQHIKHLIYPLQTILDESLGAAFWFACRGQSSLNKEETMESITTSARVIIVGSGADELFGGYQRHRNAYKRCKGSELEKQCNVAAELDKDWIRLPSRNLARDDRIVADNSQTLRAPFLEENVVQFVRSLKPDQRCCFFLNEGLGEKLFLRLYGHKLGLCFPVTLKKRAIQFGSKIALKNQNGNDQSEYLKIS